MLSKLVIKKLVLLLSSIGLLFFFQNCDEMEFSNNLPYMSLEALPDDTIQIDPIGSISNDDSGVNNDSNSNAGNNNSNNNNDNSESDDSVAEEEHNHADDVADNEGKKQCNKDKNHSKDKEHASKDDDRRFFRCQLAGPGKSHHLSLVNEAPSSQTKMPQSICMSKRACEEIVSAKIEVVEARAAVQCEKNIAGVVHLNDLEVELLMSKY